MHHKFHCACIINALKPAHTCFLLNNFDDDDIYLIQIQILYVVLTSLSIIILYSYFIFRMRLSLLLLLLLLLHILTTTLASSRAMSGVPPTPTKNDPESSTHTTTIRLHFSRYSSAEIAYHDDQKRLVPTGANPLHNRQNYMATQECSLLL